METMTRLALALTLGACSAPSTQPLRARGEVAVGTSRDGGSPTLDAAVDDAGPLEVDSGPRLDGGSPDAGSRDGGTLSSDGGAAACSLVAQDCPASLTCRRTRGDESLPSNPRHGPPECQSFGTIQDNNFGLPASRRCMPGDCARGLFCQSYGTCRRFCEPAGTPCPPTPSGSPQTCITDGIGIDPYCSDGSG